MKIEKRSIDYIPTEERYGDPKSLFDVWFSANMHITGLVTGALSVNFGLNIFWSVVAIIMGNCLGAIFMALHSAQGPKLGIPQMIQSRAQFGVYGAILPIGVVILMYLGFFASSNLLGAEALSGILSINLNWSIIILSSIVFLVTFLGYDVIHKLQKYLKWVFILAFIIATVVIIQLPIPPGSLYTGNFNAADFMLSVSVIVTWQLSYAPYVADYSRYLPTDSSTSETFWYTYLGTVLASIWMMFLGAILTTSINNYLDHASSNLAHLFGPFSLLMFIVIFLGQLSINVFNLYGAFMSTTTIIEPFFKWKVTPIVRGILLFCITIVGTSLAVLGQTNFLNLFSNFILFLSYFLIPWTAINLIDFYLLRHGHYEIEDVFDTNGQYGKINWITTIAFILSVIVEIPFVNSLFYVGPISSAFGGADLTWIVGLITPIAFYYFPMKHKLYFEKYGKLDNKK